MQPSFSLRVAALACGLSLTACSDICDRIQSSHAKLAQKAQACGVDEGGFDVASCKKTESKCLSTDLATVNKAWDCLDRLSTCSNATDFETAQHNCVSASQITPDCAPAVDIDGGV